ncbi:auxin-responsive protein SAUR36-like [Lycium barbarum]|uniref:auxin-responsive protein SAUR36-like n=1 Tax=Lycium barbarum TaxID=112863 RepID=UPI00293EF80A|nr:auxin-responsive protein SAUR36-like [Lycium barbarum]
MMKKSRGFKIGRRLVRIFSCFLHRRTKGRIGNKRLSCATKAISKLFKFGRMLKHGAKGLCKPNSGYIRVGQEPVDPKKVSVPKGHLAVYVGEKEDDTCRIVVPVMFFNHPLFAELLREAEMVYGYNYPGRIQIPCRVSEFENVKSRIAATGGGGELRWRQNY